MGYCKSYADDHLFFATDTKKGKTEKNLPKAMAVK